METANAKTITVKTTVNAPVETVWESWTNPKHITNWCQASPDWHAPYADNDLKPGGSFKTTMAAKDGSFSFDFGGVYTSIEEKKMMAYTMDDGRKVTVKFQSNGNTTDITETFEPETANSMEMQQTGWQAILDNFKNYTETL